MSKNTSTTFFKKAILIGLLPLAEVICLRIYFSYSKIKVGWGWFVTEYDLALTSLIAFLALIFFLEKGAPCQVSLRRKMLSINFVALVVFVLFSHFFLPLGFRFLWWLSLSVLIATAFLSSVEASYYFKNPNRIAIPFCLLVAFSQVFYQHSFSYFWPVLFPKTALVSCQILRGLLGPLKCGFDAPDLYHLQHDQFRVFLGTGCGGFDSLFFFSFSFLFFWFLNRRRIHGWQLVPLFTIGLIGMYCLNILRITGLFLFGFLLSNFLRPQLVYPLMLGFFHTNIGWILYALGIGLYFKLASTWILMQGRQTYVVQQEGT